MKRLLRIALIFATCCLSAGSANFVAADDHAEIVDIQREAVPCANGIKLTASERTSFEIYSITGQKVKSAVVDSGSAIIELPKGCYIVRCPQWSKKVVVK